MIFQDILDALPQLNVEQLDKLVAAADHLRGGRKPLPGDRAMVLFNALQNVLASSGIRISPRLPSTTVWKSQVAVALAFVERTTPGLSRIEFRALAGMYAGALVEYTINVCHLGPRAVPRMVGRLADAVEHAFPGYAANGLLLRLVRKGPVKAEKTPVHASKGEGATSGA